MKLNKQNDVICTLGSCFALEIRKELENRGYKTLPSGDSNRELVWYNTFSILYEFKRAFTDFSTDYNDCWKISDGRWQEPSRRLVFSSDINSLKNKSEQLDKEIVEGIQNANVYIITLGMCEVFKHKNSGRIICSHPQYGLTSGKRSGGLRLVDFHNSTKEESYENLKTIYNLVTENNPNSSIIFTVSPVPLLKTFTKKPLNVANDESKQKLQWAAKTFSEKNPNVYYFDSFEYCMSIPPQQRYRKDMRHVQPHVISNVISRFENQFID
jgi:hypothetical protein